LSPPDQTDELDGTGPVFGDSPEEQRLAAIYLYWAGKRRGRTMPSRADIDPLELRSYLPQLVLLDVEGDPPRFRYRLVGTEVTRVRRGLSNSDPTGRFVDEVTHHQGTGAVLAHYRRVVAERKPSTDAGTYPPSPERPWLRFSRLVMPLSRDDVTVNMLLVALMPMR
jgi:PAS domain